MYLKSIDNSIQSKMNNIVCKTVLYELTNNENPGFYNICKKKASNQFALQCLVLTLLNFVINDYFYTCLCTKDYQS